MLNGFRLSLTSGSAVSAEGTTASTIYLMPYTSNAIEVFFNNKWKFVRTNDLVSLALSGLTSGSNYDVFAYWQDQPTPKLQLELQQWSDATNRLIALQRQDGVLVKSTDFSRRYLGTCRTTSTTQVPDTTSKRFLWNYYNRVDRILSVVDSTDTWTFIAGNLSPTYQPANGAVTGSNRVEYVSGDPENSVTLVVHAQGLAHGANSLTSSFTAAAGIGQDSGVVNNATIYGSNLISLTLYTPSYSELITTSFLGRRVLYWEDGSNSSGIFGYIGDNGTTITQTGMIGKIQG